MRSNSSIFREDLENEQICPITQALFQDPVVIKDGHTYERRAILGWFEKEKRELKEIRTSPKTNLPLPSEEIIPNHALRNLVTHFIPRLMIRYEGQKEQRLKQIQQLNLKHENQKRKFQNQYSQIKIKYQNQIEQIKQLAKIQYQRLLGKKQKQIYELNIYFEQQNKKKQKELAQLKQSYQKQIMQLKLKSKLQYEGQLKKKEHQIKQLKLEQQNQQRKKYKQFMCKIKAENQQEIQQLKQKTKNKFKKNPELEKNYIQQQKQKNKKQKQFNSEKYLNNFKYLDNRLNQINQLELQNDREISLNNLLKQSQILDKKGLQLLIKWLVRPILRIQLKFKASSNDFKMKKYYETCGDLNNTIIIAKTQQDKILGGYTPLSFNPPGNKWTYSSDNQRIKDESNTSFLFSLSTNQKFELIQKQKKAITRYKDKRSINFIGKFWIFDNSYTYNKNGNPSNSFYLNDKKYNTSEYYPYPSKQNYLKITGYQYAQFFTQQWEVYQVFFA